ncbi:MAG: DUF4382 domain-containing protein [Chloroflexi bacterium]|nr:DUF4382 domain-containing protein [Chloroflexota bacterium]
MKISGLASFIVIGGLVAGCGGSDGVNETGSMSLRITDAPIDDASSVVVQFSAVQIRGAEDSQNIDFTFDTPRSIDLLTLQGTATETLFTDETVPAGVYDEVRLIVNAVEGTTDSYITLTEGGAQHHLTVPSGSTSGLKVKGAFTVPANGSASFTVDFDVRKSIVRSGSANSANGIKYHLKPALRVVEDARVGTISGSVDTILLNASCSDQNEATHNAVYVFEGAGVTPDDIDGDGVEPVVTALLKYDAGSDSYGYQAAFLLEGDYTATFSCHADLEDIEASDDLFFVGAQDVSVVAGETATADFAQ